MADIVEQKKERDHSFHAEAHALSGYIALPLRLDITPHALTSVPPEGGYRAQQASEFRLETVISYGRAHTQVSGHRESEKKGFGWNTLATSVIEDVNILNVVTADRVVAQVHTHHPERGYMPRVSFLGTHFHNLRIAGHLVDLDLDLEIFGETPENDRPYTRDKGFIERVSKQHARLREHENVFEEILDRYNRVPESFDLPEGGDESAECSLVRQARGSYPGKTCGHVIRLRDFGTIYLATVKLEHEDYCSEARTHKKTTLTLEMIRAEMGCIATGSTGVGTAKTNGQTTH